MLINVVAKDPDLRVIQKIIKILAAVVKIKVLLFSALIVFGPRFGTLLGSFWESIWPPGNAETTFLGGLGPSKSRFLSLPWAPKVSKRALRAFQEASRRAQERSEAPGTHRPP